MLFLNYELSKYNEFASQQALSQWSDPGEKGTQGTDVAHLAQEASRWGDNLASIFLYMLEQPHQEILQYRLRHFDTSRGSCCSGYNVINMGCRSAEFNRWHFVSVSTTQAKCGADWAD